MKGILAAIVLLLMTMGASFAQSQEDTYTLKPEDVLRIQVYEHQDIAAEVPVGRDGNITAPFVGTVRAEGKTVAELTTELVALYHEKLRIRDPKVSVVVISYRPVRASVGGQVQKPGVYPIRPGDTIMTLLHWGGDAIPLSADLRRATFHRAKTNELIPLDLYSMLQLGDLSQNYTVEDGDELYVPEERKNHITVLGLVQQPGFYNYREPMYLSDAIAVARGEVPTRSQFSKTMVYREKPGSPGEFQRIQVNYVRYVRNGDSSQNIELKPGDMIYVPETNTPNWDRISGIANSLFFFDRFFNQGIFGFRPFR